MIELGGFPAPANAPAPGSCVRVERPEPGLAVVVLDPPHRKLAVFDAPLLRDLDQVVSELAADASLQGVVITGRDPYQFAAGADIEAIGAIQDPIAVQQIVLAVHGLFGRIAGLRARSVAAVGGAVPGGAYEIALCCDLIVASDDEKTRIGLPETQLGILPGWGGSHRLPERVGIPLALDVILPGKLLPAKVCLRRGMIDRLTKPEYLLRVASDLALGRAPLRRARRGWKRWAVDRNPLARLVIDRQARKRVLAQTRGHYPAPLAALELVLSSPGATQDEAAAREARAVAELATGPVAKNLVAIFLASEEAKHARRLPDGSAPPRIERAAVLGAGVMGAGIASVLAQRGVAVRLSDQVRPALDKAVFDHRAALAKKRAARRLAAHEESAALDRLDAVQGLVGLGRAQIVIEAIAEKLEVKRAVFAELAGLVPADCILATNTSSLSVGEIARGLAHPERVVGMHFFNPVPAMPLVEVVRAEETAPEVVSAVAALALALGKTPLVVRDVAGFLVNRLLGPYLDEAVRLFVGGADPLELDGALLDFGMPMGPLALLDEVGFDIAKHAAASLHAAYGERMLPSRGLELMASPERLGKKTGLGFYRHPRGKRAVLAGDLAQFQTESFARGFTNAELAERCVLAMVNEGARCLEERVVAGPVELDLGTVFGTGFAPFRGGLLRHADALGTVELARRLERLAAAPDVAARAGGAERFAPAELVKTLAERAGRFHEEAGAGGPAAAKAAG